MGKINIQFIITSQFLGKFTDVKHKDLISNYFRNDLVFGTLTELTDYLNKRCIDFNQVTNFNIGYSITPLGGLYDIELSLVQ